MATKQFHLGDILSITTGRLVSPRHIDGVYDILGFMTGESLFTHALPRASDVCKPYLLRRYPQFSGEAMKEALARLSEAVKGTNRDDSMTAVNSWLKELVAVHGEMHDVETLPNDAYEAKHPVQELTDMGVDPEKIVAVRI